VFSRSEQYWDTRYSIDEIWDTDENLRNKLKVLGIKELDTDTLLKLHQENKLIKITKDRNI
jgi:hypothetical protein